VRINNNPTATSALNSLNNASQAASKSIEKLSSGVRINRAADDAAGLVTSEKLRSQVNGTKVAIRNAQDGISVVQTADGALNEVTAILQRGRDLAMAAANDGAQSTESVAAAQAEWDALASEIDRIADSTTFAGTKLLDGAFAKDFVVGYSAAGGDVVNVAINAGGTTAFDSAGLGLTSLTLDAAAVATLDTAITTVTTARGNLGAVQNRFEHTVSNLNNVLENYSAAESRIRDTDMAAEMTNLTKSQILTQASTAMLAQANQAPQGVLSLLR